MNVYALPTDGDYYWKRIRHTCLPLRLIDKKINDVDGIVKENVTKTCQKFGFRPLTLNSSFSF